MIFLDSNMEPTDESWLHGCTRAVQLMRTAFLKAASSMLKQLIFPASNSHIDLPKKQASQQLIRQVISEGLQGLLKGERLCSLDMTFPLSPQLETGAFEC